MVRMDHLGTANLELLTRRKFVRSAGFPKRQLSLKRPGEIPDLVLPPLAPLSSRRNLPQYPKRMGGSLRQASNSVASRPPAIDLKLRLALRVAALAALCFIAVAA